MAIATFDDLVFRQKYPRERFNQGSKQAFTSAQAGRVSSLWSQAPDAGAIPTTAVVPARDIAGAIGQQNGGGTALRIPAIDVGFSSNGVMILCDRLSHQGGLAGNVATPQTTNLPTAALTRYTSGVGVMCMLEIHTIIGTTSTTVSVSYTDQDGNTGNTSPLVVIGNTNFREAWRGIVIPCAAGDTGFRAVASVTLTATTGTAGNIGVTLFKPLLYLPISWSEAYLADPVLGTLGGGLPEILDDACLFWIVLTASPQPSTGQNYAVIPRFAED